MVYLKRNLLAGLLPPKRECDGGNFIAGRQGRRRGEQRMDVKLYVGNMPYTTTEDELRTLFSQAGAVASVAVIKDRDTGQSKGFGFIEMATQAEAQKAITMFNRYRMGDRELTVNLARPREDRGGSGGRPGGGGGFGDRRGAPGGNRQRRGGSGGGERRY
jgi:RNA recognition motif-containing protein